MPPMSPEDAQEYRDTLSLMSAEELKSMQGDGEEEDDIIKELLAGGKAVEVPGGAKADDPDDNPEPEDDPEDEPDDDPDADPEPEPDPEPVPQPDPEPAPAAPAANDFTPPPLDLSGVAADYKAQLDALTAEKKAAFAKLMGGEMDPEAYSDLEEKNLAARETLREEQKAQTDWLAQVHNFRVKAAQETGINYFDDTEKFDAFDGWIKNLGSNPRNADKPAAWFLEEAHKKVMVEFDIAPPAAKTAQTTAKTVADGKKVASKTARTPNLSEIPPTLGGLPAAASANAGDGGEFAHLDKLSGMDFERAIARMTPDQRDRWSQL